MAFEVIRKDIGASAVPPNLLDYQRTRAEFSWDALRRELQGLPQGGLNIAHEAVDRHADGTAGRHVALRWLGQVGRRARLDATATSRADRPASPTSLQDLGVGQG